MSAAEMLRISAGVAAGRLPDRMRESAVSRMRGTASAYRFAPPSARGLRPDAPGSLAYAEKERLVTAEMRASRIDLGRPSGIDRLGDRRMA